MKTHLLVRRSRATVVLAAGLPLLNSTHKLSAQTTSPQPAALAQPFRLWAPVQDKNFYLLSLIEHTPEAQKAIAENPALKQLASAHGTKLTAGFRTSQTDWAAAVNSMLWTDAEIASAGEALRELYKTSAAVKRLVDGPLRESGTVERWRTESGDELLVKAWGVTAGGINHIIRVYGLGGEPHYPKIDSVSYDVKGKYYGEIVNIAFGMLEEDKANSALFFQPSLRFALALMDSNRRDESGRFEPMESGENKAAFERARKIQWEKYPYSVILFPGHGLEEEKVALHPKAKLILKGITKRYNEGKAPFIIVSGGYVHPNQTPYCEAVEMKRSLIRDFDVPENAIIIDPHARHTTTNLRNASRLMYRYNLPFNKQALIMSTPAQIKTINSQKFQERCTRELGYQPANIGKQLSAFDLEFTPRIDSLQIDPTDPLDP